MGKKLNLAVRWPTYFISQRQFFPRYHFFRPNKKKSLSRIHPVLISNGPIVLLAFLKVQPRSHEMFAVRIHSTSRPKEEEEKKKDFR